MSKERLYLQCGNDDKGCQVVALTGEQTLTITNFDDWAGCSETGFGESVTTELSRADASNLRDLLNLWLEGDQPASAGRG